MTYAHHPQEAFKTLGIPVGSPPEEIRRAYRKLARQFHPDLSKAADAEVRFKEVQLAYVLLDEAGACGIETPQALHTGVESTMELDFTTLNQAERPAGLDETVEVEVSLEDAVAGTEVLLRIKCPERDPLMRNVRSVERPARVRLPGGLVHGEQLRVPGLASLGAGDLHIVVRFKKHPVFLVNGTDIFMKYPIAPWEAVLGAILDIPTLQGVVQVTLKPGIGAGQKLRLQGRGLARPSGGNGDLYCILRVVTPRAVGERERALYRELAEISRFQPREQVRL